MTMVLTIDNNRLRDIIPNVVHEVQSEMPLLTKLRPWLDSAALWLTDNFLGADYEVPEALLPLVEKIIVRKAFAEAVPSLDVSLTPSGFAVISTEGRAPASKERMERLIASIKSSVDANIVSLVSHLLHTEIWLNSPMGQWWCGTFIPDLSVVRRFCGDAPLLDTYRSIRSHALRFEQEVAERFMGYETLSFLRSQQFMDTQFSEIITMIRQAELRYISFHIRDERPECPGEHEMWHLIRPLIERIKYYPDLYRRWHAEMGDCFKVEDFKNDIKGAFYF